MTFLFTTLLSDDNRKKKSSLAASSRAKIMRGPLVISIGIEKTHRYSIRTTRILRDISLPIGTSPISHLEQNPRRGWTAWTAWTAAVVAAVVGGDRGSYGPIKRARRATPEARRFRIAGQLQSERGRPPRQSCPSVTLAFVVFSAPRKFSVSARHRGRGQRDLRARRSPRSRASASSWSIFASSPLFPPTSPLPPLVRNERNPARAGPSLLRRSSLSGSRGWEGTIRHINAFSRFRRKAI